MAVLTYSGALVMRTCWCGIRHAIPAELSGAADKDSEQTVYCPLGHAWVSSVHERSESEKLREQLAAERQRARAKDDLLQHEQRSHAATRGHLTRTKRRVAAGTCPCCNRTFQQLARHMENKHPEYAAQQSREAVSPAKGKEG